MTEAPAKIPLCDQCEAGIAILNAAMATRGMVVPAVRPKIEQLMKTLEWIKDKPDVLKAAAQIASDEWIKKAKAAFPAGEITGVE